MTESKHQSVIGKFGVVPLVTTFVALVLMEKMWGSDDESLIEILVERLGTVEFNCVPSECEADSC